MRKIILYIGELGEHYIESLLYKRWDIFWVAEQLLVLQEEVYSM